MIPITKPWLGEEEAAAAGQAIRSGWVTQGKKVAEFERVVVDYGGAAHAVAVTSCTTALHLSLIALGIGAGDEVICPSMSFIATANAIRHAGAAPVFAEVDPRTFNLDVAAAAAAITPRTKAIMPVHQIGLPADIDAFRALAAKHHVRLIEDAACAIGSGYKDKAVGHCTSAAGATDAVCFSFHPRKLITTGEGGMILTDDAALADQLRLLRQHGMSVPDTKRHAASTVIIEEYPVLGYNFRMTDIQAAIGLEQMKKLEDIVSRRRAWAQRYDEALKALGWLDPPFVPAWARPNYQSYAATLNDRAPIDRNELMQRLLDRGVASRRGIMLAHRERPYKDAPAMPVSERASDRSVLLPLYPQMTDMEFEQVIRALREAGKRM